MQGHGLFKKNSGTIIQETRPGPEQIMFIEFASTSYFRPDYFDEKIGKLTYLTEPNQT
jgi:hypothetical protein